MVGPTLDDLDGDAYAASVERKRARKGKGGPPPGLIPSSPMSSASEFTAEERDSIAAYVERMRTCRDQGKSPPAPMPSAPELTFPDFKGSKTCRLLELPAELRTEIFQYALTQDSGEVKFDLRPQSPQDIYPRARTLAFSLTMTCSQIHRESGDMVYEFNTITFYTDLFCYTDPAPSRKFHAILAKQMQSQKLKAVKFQLGALGGASIINVFNPIQSTLRKLRKNVRTLKFDCTLDDVPCEFGTTTAPDAIQSIRDAWGNGKVPPRDPNNWNDSHHKCGVEEANSLLYILRSFSPFWSGTTIF